MTAENDSLSLINFEAGLNPSNLSESEIPAVILGFGEISTIFQIGTDQNWAYKRMPLFKTPLAAETYADNYRTYCKHLRSAGLKLPEDKIEIVALPNRPVVLYLIQRQLPPEWFAHHLIQNMTPDSIAVVGQRLAGEINKVWWYNQSNQLAVEIALDGQISNWVFEDGDIEQGRILYIDTSTPLFRLAGIEQLDPELLLQSTPGFLRWIIRTLFLKDVMNRYYNQRQVLIDLAANLYKEQRPDLIEPLLVIINSACELSAALTTKEINSYYQEDRIIWTVFLAFRRFDRWLTQTIFHGRYDFILPGKIKR